MLVTQLAGMCAWRLAATVGCSQITAQLQVRHVPCASLAWRALLLLLPDSCCGCTYRLLWQAVHGVPDMLQKSFERDQAQRDTASLVCL
jgi:hypothetical protein